MKNLATILVLLATSASYVVSLPTEGNIPRGPGNHLQTLPIYARETRHNAAKGKGSAAANNVTTIANNGTENANTGKKNGKKGTKGQENNNNSTTVSNGKGQGNKNNGTSANTGNGKGQGNANGSGKGNGQDLLGQLIADLEAKLGVNLGQNNQVDQNVQGDVADLLKLLGARDESANAAVARGTDRNSD